MVSPTVKPLERIAVVKSVLKFTITVSVPLNATGGTSSHHFQYNVVSPPNTKARFGSFPQVATPASTVAEFNITNLYAIV